METSCATRGKFGTAIGRGAQKKNHSLVRGGAFCEAGERTMSSQATIPSTCQLACLLHCKVPYFILLLAFQKSGKRQSQGALFYRTLGRYIYMCSGSTEYMWARKPPEEQKNMASYLGAERTQRRGGNINYMSEPGVLLQGTIYLPPYASRKEHTLMQIHPHQCYFLWF